MNTSMHRFLPVLAFVLILLRTAPPALGSEIVPSVTIGEATVYEVADQCPPDSQALYDEALQDVYEAMDSGDISDDQLLTYLLENEDLLSQDYEALSEAVLPVTVEEVIEGIPTADWLKNGGVVRGTRWSFRNIFGWEVGSGQVNVSWNNNADACHSKISGHSFSGSIPLGSCSAKQVGAKFTRPCSPTPACESRSQECGNYHVECKQVFRFCRLGSVSTPLETICAPCP